MNEKLKNLLKNYFINKKGGGKNKKGVHKNDERDGC